MNNEQQLWALAFEANDGSAGIYPFHFTPTDEIKSPDLDAVLKMFGLDDSEDEDAGGWIERIDRVLPILDYPIYPSGDTVEPLDGQNEDPFVNQTVHFGAGESDITVVTPSGEKIVLQYRDEGTFPSLDICFEKQRQVTCWARDMEEAPKFGNRSNERNCFQLWIGLDPKGEAY